MEGAPELAFRLRIPMENPSQGYEILQSGCFVACAEPCSPSKNKEPAASRDGNFAWAPLCSCAGCRTSKPNQSWLLRPGPFGTQMEDCPKLLLFSPSVSVLPVPCPLLIKQDSFSPCSPLPGFPNLHRLILLLPFGYARKSRTARPCQCSEIDGCV